MVGVAVAADENSPLRPCEPNIKALKLELAELEGHVPSGHVLVEYTIDLRGHAIDAEIIESSNKRLNDPTLKAVASWRFALPAQACRRRTPITYRIEDAEVDDSVSDCSPEGFVAFGRTWAGIPVIPGAKAVKPSINGSSCGFGVDASLRTIEEWYRDHLVADGWRPLRREELDTAIILFFERDDLSLKLYLSPSLGGTVVLLSRPEPGKAKEPTR